MSPLPRWTLSVAVCVSSHVSVLCVFAPGHVLSFATSWACKRESSSQIPQPGQRPKVPGLGSSSQAGGSPGTEQLEKDKKRRKLAKPSELHSWNLLQHQWIQKLSFLCCTPCGTLQTIPESFFGKRPLSEVVVCDLIRLSWVFQSNSNQNLCLPQNPRKLQCLKKRAEKCL